MLLFGGHCVLCALVVDLENALFFKDPVQIQLYVVGNIVYWVIFALQKIFRFRRIAKFNIINTLIVRFQLGN